MPRPKSKYSDHKHLFNNVVVLNEKELIEDNNFNVNSKVIVECANKHTYQLSITKVKSLGKIPENCPHCVKYKKYTGMGIPYETLQDWSHKYGFNIINKKDFYNRYTDTLQLQCNKHKFTKEIKSLYHLEQNISSTEIECQECLGKYNPLSDLEIQNILEVSNPHTSVILNNRINYELLPPSLKQKIQNQTKWILTEYINTKQKCKYQCVDCGFVKECLPYNIFLDKGFGCLGCNKNDSKHRIIDKLRSLCYEYDFYPNKKIDYTDIDAPLNLICNKCGNLYTKTWKDVIGCYYKITCDKCFSSTKRKSQTEFSSFIKSLGLNIECDNKTLISPYELDIVCHSGKVAFEFCGTIWHSTKFKTDRNYHINKYKKCRELGYRLITIFDDEWKDRREVCESRICSILGKSNKHIYARKCDIIEVSNETARKFFLDNHIQGSPSKTGLSIGLKIGNDIVGMMSFGMRHGKIKSQDTEWELQRYCSIKRVNICGGASRLLNYFLKKYPDVNVVTFSDNRWGDSDFYTKIGFEESKNIGVDYSYCGSETNWKRKHKFGFDKKKLIKKCIKSNISVCKEDTELTLSEKLCLYRVYDCGHKRYILRKKSIM